MKSIVIVVALLLASPANGEESSTVFTPYSGIEVTAYKKINIDQMPRHMSIRQQGNKTIVIIRDLFLCDEPLEKPYIMEAGEKKAKKATLNIGMKRPKFFTTGCQEMMELTIGIKRSRLEKKTILYVYNENEGRVLGHLIVP